MIKWGWAREYQESAVGELEDQLFEEMPLIEQKVKELMQAEAEGSASGEDVTKSRKFLTRYTSRFARGTMQRWWELGDFFWAGLARGW
jgi:hypothetical protein